MKKRLIAAAIFSMVMLAGCGSSGNYATETEMAVDNAVSDVYEEAKMPSMESMSSDYLKDSNRKLIKTVRITTETENYDDFMTQMSQKINEYGGYVQEMSESGSVGYRYANLTVRVPKESLNDFLGVISDNTNITYRNESVEDVTLQYVDLDSHKRMLKTEEERLLELLELASSVEDIITIESELTNVRYQIESMESQLRTMDNRIDFSTVYLNIDEVVRYTPQEQLSTWGRIKTGFVSNLLDLGEAICDIFVELVIHIPNIILTGVILAAIIFVLRKVNKKKQKKQKEDK